MSKMVLKVSEWVYACEVHPSQSPKSQKLITRLQTLQRHDLLCLMTEDAELKVP